MSEFILEIKNLEVRYRDEIALSGINLKIKEGDFVAILGPNGAGKSTLLKAVLGIIKPSKGKIKIFGKSITELDRKLIGYVPQYMSENSAIPLRVIDIVKMGRYPHLGVLRYLKSGDYEKVDEIIDFLNINDIKNKLFSELSGGQKQRVLIARALVNEPKLLILDEPTTGLDVNSSEGLYGMLNNLHKKYKLTILLVTHDAMAVSDMVSSVACLNKNIAVHGKPEEVLTGENLQCLYGKHYLIFGHGKIPHMVVKKIKRDNGDN